MAKTMGDFFSAGNCIWVVLMVIWAAIYGIGAPLVNWPPMRSQIRYQHTGDAMALRIWWWCYQIVFNVAGVVVGWMLVYFLLQTSTRDFNLGHAVAAVVAFLGITGNLPQVTLNLKTLFPTG